jgi:hypothetical protein
LGTKKPDGRPVHHHQAADEPEREVYTHNNVAGSIGPGIEYCRNRMADEHILIVQDEKKIADVLKDYLRKKLAESLPGKDVITTIYGVGYKLTP